MSPAPDDSAEAIAPGRVLADRYVVEGTLGRGATGVVLAARDVRSDRNVALKILHRDTAEDPIGRRRFAREARISAHLDHPNVVRVLDEGVVDDLPYIVMEQLPGGTLTEWLERVGRPPLGIALDLAAQILSGVTAAHARGLIHRDLKPSNVLLVDDQACPRVKVSDFGVAKSLSLLEDAQETTTLTVRGELCGTPAYMAPEQAQGEELDGRADLYSIGVLLFQLTTGKLPFTGKTAIAIVSRHLTEPPPRPSALVGEGTLPPALEALILRALAKDRAERPSSADVFLADLNQIGRDLPRWQRDKRSGAMTGDVTLVPGLVGTAATPKTVPYRRAAAIATTFIAALTILALMFRDHHRHEPALVATRSPAPVRPTVAAVPLPSRERSVEAVAAPPAGHELRPVRAVRKPRAGVPAASSPSPPPAPPVAAEQRDRRVAELLEQGEALLSEGRRRDACELGEQAKRLTADAPDVFRFLGKCYMRFGAHDQGRAHYRRYLELAPNAPDARFVRAMIEP